MRWGQRHGRMLRRLVRDVPLAVVLLSGCHGTTDPPRSPCEDDWSQWRGPARDGRSHVTDFETTWPVTGPPALWTFGTGNGLSSPSVSCERVYILGSDDLKCRAFCLDLATGAELWAADIGDAYPGVGLDPPGPRSTPTVDEGRVFCLGPSGNLVALDTGNGSVLWKHALPEEFGGRKPPFGYAGSPVVIGNRLLVEVGGPDGFAYMAFDKATGEPIWHSEDDRAAYSSPLPVRVDGLTQVIFFSWSEIVSIRPENGDVYWRLPWATTHGINAATPLFVPPDRVLVTSGKAMGAMLIQMKQALAGIEPIPLWRERSLGAQNATPVLHNGHVYGFDSHELVCLDVETGERKWKRGLAGRGALTVAGGHLIAAVEEVGVVVVEASPDSLHEIAASPELAGQGFSAPVLAGHRLLYRAPEELMCLDVTPGFTLSEGP